MTSRPSLAKPTRRVQVTEGILVVTGSASIVNQLGMHARSAMSFVQLASGFQSNIRVRRSDSTEWVDGKSIMQMLLLAATTGTTIEISCDGPDDARALTEVIQLIERKFDED